MSYPADMRNFLVVYNRRTGANHVREFPAGHGREAIRERFLLERQHRGDLARLEQSVHRLLGGE